MLPYRLYFSAQSDPIYCGDAELDCISKSFLAWFMHPVPPLSTMNEKRLALYIRVMFRLPCIFFPLFDEHSELSQLICLLAIHQKLAVV